MRAAPLSADSSDGIELGQGRFRQKSQAAEVDAENRHLDIGLDRAVGDRQQRAVAAEHDQQVDAGDQRRLVGDGAAGGRRHQRRGRGLEHGVMAALGQPRFNRDQVRRRFAQVRLGDDADAGHADIVQRSIALMMAVSAAFTGQSMPARRPSAATAPFM